MGLLSAGAGEFINIDSVLAPLSAANGTWIIWVKFTSTPANGTPIIQFGDTDAYSLIYLAWATGGKLVAHARVNGVDKWLVTTDNQVFFNNIWGQLIIIHNATTPFLFVNSTFVPQTFSIITDKSVWLNGIPGLDNGRICNYNFNNLGNVGNFPGEVTEALFWKTNLNGPQILATYNPRIKGISLDVQIADRVGYYPMDDVADGISANGATIRELWNGNDGIATNLTGAAEEVLSYPGTPMYVRGSVSVAGAIMNQIQGPNLGSDLFNGALM